MALLTPFKRLFYTYLKLQGSQTIVQVHIQTPLFYTYLKLQGSQTSPDTLTFQPVFYTYLKLQGSQTMILSI